MTDKVQEARVKAATAMAEAIQQRSQARHELLHMPSTVSAERRQQLERHIERLSEGS